MQSTVSHPANQRLHWRVLLSGQGLEVFDQTEMVRQQASCTMRCNGMNNTYNATVKRCEQYWMWR